MPVACSSVIARMLVLFLEASVKVVIHGKKPEMPKLSTQWWHFFFTSCTITFLSYILFSISMYTKMHFEMEDKINVSATT